jgi:hypothetical protein
MGAGVDEAAFNVTASSDLANIANYIREYHAC